MLILLPAGVQDIETPTYTGKVRVLTLLVPEDQVPNVDRNDTYRRQVTQEIAQALALTNPQENP